MWRADSERLPANESFHGTLGHNVSIPIANHEPEWRRIERHIDVTPRVRMGWDRVRMGWDVHPGRLGGVLLGRLR